MTPLATAGDIDEVLGSRDLFQDPYTVYRELQERYPVYWSDAWGTWILTRYADVHATLRDPARFASGGRIEMTLDAMPDDVQPRIDPLREHFRAGLIHSDPPDHTRLRALVRHAFTPRMIDRLRPRVAALVDELLDAAMQRGEFDVLRDLAYPLPATVIAEMLGADPADRDRFRHWSDEAVSFQGVARPEPELVERAQAALLDMKDYLRTLRDLRRADPRDDVISALAAAEEEGDRLTDDELVNTCVTLLIAGHETTTCLISSGLVTLLTQDGAAERLRRDPALIEPAVEELLRFETPKQRDFRLLTEDVELHGQTMRQGQLVVQLLGAANRDPRQFEDPDAFVLDRKPNRHIAFGFGIHFCLGSPLARLEGREAITAVLQRMPRLELAADRVEWDEKNLFRVPRAVPVRF